LKYLISLLSASILAAPVAAQIDYRNLDHGRPTAVEDAYPVERYGFELSGGYQRAGRSGGVRHLLVPELVYGLAKGAHAAVRLPFAIPSGPSAGSGGLAGVDLTLLVNLSTERIRLPGLAVRVDASLPAGGAGGRGAAVALSGLATSSFGPHRLHLNATLALDTPEVPGEAGPANRWWTGLAVDRTLLRQSTLLVAEVSAGSEGRGAPVVFSVGAGVRRQITPTLVFDLGLGREFARRTRPETVLTLGLSHVVGLAFLMPGSGR
jgi:hypothetical protein